MQRWQSFQTAKMLEADWYQAKGFLANDLLEVIRKAQLTEYSLDADFPKRRYADENFICCIGDLAART
jgi:hypothetical protein